MKRKKIAVAIPLYDEAGTIEELWSRLDCVLHQLDYDTEVVFVDDGSSDGTFERISAISSTDTVIKCLKLSRNFGHQAALSAAVDHAQGDAVVLMDGDLQDKPEAIVEFVKEWEKGFQAVYAIRSSRQESALKQLAFKSFYWFLASLSGVSQPLHAGIFGLVDSSLLDVIRSMPEHNRYFPGLRAYAGFKQTGVEVARDARHAGAPRVGIRGLFKLAFDAIFSFSYVPIRAISCVGWTVALGAFLFILVIAYKKFVSDQAILGWPSTLGAVLLIGGLQLVMLGIVGEYVGRIYEETKKRPLYVVAEQTNSKPNQANA